MKTPLPQSQSSIVWWMIVALCTGWLLTVSGIEVGASSEIAQPAVTDLPTVTETETPVPPTTTPTATITETPTWTGTPTLTRTATSTITPTPGCELIDAGSFIVAGGDGLQFTVTNNNAAAVNLTSTTLSWTDYYDPEMLVDYFRFGVIQYWDGDGFDSPTTVNSTNVVFDGGTVADWTLDFDGYAIMYGQTHTIGPFSIELTFNNSPDCVVSATIPGVHSEIFKPTDGQIITSINQTNFEAKGWDTGVGTNNGDGINRMHIVILDPSGNVIVNRNDTIKPFCAWGNQNPCPQMSSAQWNTLPNGQYTMIAWARSSVTGSWSPPDTVTFILDRGLPTATPSLTVTPTATSTATITSTVTPLPSETPTPTDTLTPSSTDTETPTPTALGPTSTPTYTPTPDCSLILPGDFTVFDWDQLQFPVVNNNVGPVALTNATLTWTDYYHPDMFVDYFRFGTIQYLNSDDFESPTTATSNIPLLGQTSENWSMDFDGYGNLYGQTHTIGPFSIELTFNENCVVTSTISAVVAEIINPVDGQIFSNDDLPLTDFEVEAWDTGIGNGNGDGINRVHIVIIDPNGNVVINRNDIVAPFCAWGDADPCVPISSSLWDSMPNGDYTMFSWARSGMTSSWSPPDIATFTLNRVLPPLIVEGTVLLQGRTTFSDTQVTLYHGGNLIGETLTDVNGYYSFTVPGDSYEVVVERDTYLDSVKYFIPSSPITTLPTLTLLGGDSNDSDTINIFDLAFIGAHYGLNEGDPGWSPAADINGDGTVNILDLTIAASNFRKSSPVPW